MKKTSKRKINKHKKTRKQKQRGGNSMLNPYTLPSNTIPLNTFNNDPVSMTISSRINIGGKSKKYKRKQTPFYPRKTTGGDALLGSSYNTISSFGTTSGIPFSSNTLFGHSNEAPANGIADIPFFGKHNLPLV